MNPQNEDLLEAAERGELGKVKKLLDEGADVNARSSEWWTTPLHLAAAGGHLSVVKLLVERGADVNARDKDGWTPLRLAALKGHLDVVEFLVERGADVSAKNKEGKTPLDLARKRKHSDVVNFLEMVGRTTIEILDVKQGPLQDGSWGKISLSIKGSGKVKIDLEGDVEWMDPGEIAINGEYIADIPVKPKVNGEVPVKITIRGGGVSTSRIAWLNVASAQGRADMGSAWIGEEIKKIKGFLSEIGV
jgi:hypothetical protein